MTKVRQRQGRVIHRPLSYIFQMLEMGGSAQQKYDADTQQYVPDRMITPYVLRPQLLITDPEGTIPTGDYSNRMTNFSWVLISVKNGTETVLTPGSNYIITRERGVSISMNVEVGEVVKVSFTGSYTDTRRGEVQQFKWNCELTTEAQATTNVTLDHGQATSKMDLSPFKSWGQFGIPVHLKNGNENVADADASYQWQWYDETLRAWQSDFSSCLWYVSGATSKEIIIDQDYIQDILLRVRAVAYSNQDTLEIFTTRVRRWYGQYFEDIDILTGKYVFNNTDMVVLEAKVTNRSQGNIVNPSLYFDVEMFFAVGNAELEGVGYGESVTLKRNDLKSGDPRAGILVRELSCFLPLEDDDGSVLADDDDSILVSQFPTSTRETS